MLRRTWPHAGLAAVLIAAAACAGRPEPGAPADGSPTSDAGATVAAATLQFIEDDGPLALAEAKRRNVPVFVEAWAPW